MIEPNKTNCFLEVRLGENQLGDGQVSGRDTNVGKS